MTVYHVWLTGQDKPERVEASGVWERDGALFFFQPQDKRHPRARVYTGDQWSRWSVVRDDVHI